MSRPFNPSIKLPRQITAKVEAGEQIFQEAYPDALRADVPGEPAGGDPSPSPAEPVSVEEPEGGGGSPPQAGGGDAVAPKTSPPVTPPATGDELTTLKAAHTTLQGKYNSEIAAARNRMSELTDMVTSLTAQVTLMNQRANAPPVPPVADPDEEMAKNFEPELTDWIDRRVKRVAGSLQSQLAASELKVKSLEAQLGQVRKQTDSVATNSFEAALDREIDGWRAQNTDRGFLDWLATAHPDSGEAWSALLDSAVKRGDTGRVARIFRAYPGSALAQPAPLPAPADNPPRRETERVQLDTLAMPPRGRRTSIGEPRPEAVITTADVERFTADVAKGRYRGDPTAKAAIEAAIDKALTEGRYVHQPKH